MSEIEKILGKIESRFELRGPRNASQAIGWHGVYIDAKNLIAALRKAVEQRDRCVLLLNHGYDKPHERMDAELTAILSGSEDILKGEAEMTFEDLAFACDCNATTLKVYEHAIGCTAVRCWYKVDDAMAKLRNDLDAWTERANINGKIAMRYQAALGRIATELYPAENYQEQARAALKGEKNDGI